MGKDLTRKGTEPIMVSLQDLLEVMGCVPGQEQPHG